MSPAEQSGDLRRQREIALADARGSSRLVQLLIDGQLWAAVEWSDKRQGWCIEDAEGKCLTHLDSLHGTAESREAAISLAKEMIGDGRIPSPEEAKERRRQIRERKRQRPSEVRRRQQKEERDRLFQLYMQAEYAEREAAPFWESLDDVFDLSDPDIWRSNSFAQLRPRLIISLKNDIARIEFELADQRHAWQRTPADEQRLRRARALLQALTGGSP